VTNSEGKGRRDSPDPYESDNAPPTLLVDREVENRTGAIDELVDSGALRRVFAQADIASSNSMIEAWWRSVKHQWLFLHNLDSASAVERLVVFYVSEHNSRHLHCRSTAAWS
jgi:hypothetical protein